MKPKLIAQIVLVMFATTLVTMTGLSQTSFFSDTFNNGSTVNSATPVPPTASSASYEVVTCAAVSDNPTPSITPGMFTFGCPPTSSGVAEMQALFSANPVNLTSNSDYITMVIVFTNQSLNTASRAYLAVGLYNSGTPTSYPIAGGMNGTEGTGATADETGGVQLWQGYFGEQTYTGNKNEIIARGQQTAVNNTSQELLTTGSGTYSFQNPTGAEIGSAVTVGANAVMSSGTYTEVFTISLASPTSLAITNWLYAGTVTNSANLVTNMGGVASGSTFLTTGFNALAMGWYQKVTTPANNVVGIESISIFGQSTIITGPPTITSQPTNEVSVTNSYVQFSTAAVGADVGYQWYLNGVALANAGNYSGANTGTLTIYPAAATNAAALANGYYCLISGAEGFTTNTITNSLDLVSATNLVWTGTQSDAWDVDTSVNWETTNSNSTVSSAVFTGGDPVSFNDAAASASGNTAVYLTGNVAPASLYVNTEGAFTFESTGSIVGPGYAVFDGAGVGGEVELNANNTYSGGTLLTNDIYVYLENYGALGTGPLILGSAGTTVEFVNTGSGTAGVNGNIDVVSNTTFQIDGTGTYASVYFGNFSGLSSATLSFEPANLTYTNRMRFYGTSTLCNANIFIDGPSTPQAQYYGNEIAFYNASGTQTYNGVISGNGGLIVRGNGAAILNGQNTFTGGTTTSAGDLGLGASSVGAANNVTSGPLGTGYLLLDPEVPGPTGTGEIFASGGPVTIGNTIIYNSGTNNLTLEIGGTNNLTFSGSFGLNGADGNNSTTTRFIQVTNTALTTFSGSITDGAAGDSFNVTGPGGTVALSGTDTYTGVTTVSNNVTLLVNGSLTASTSVTVATNATLGGSGTIAHAVTIQTGGNLAAGNHGIGTLTINNVLTFQTGSTNIAYISGSSGNSTVSGVTTANYSGTLVPTNISGTISPGQTFTLFNAAAYTGNFTSIAGTPGAGMTWAFNPTNGVLSVVGSGVIIPNTPPKITSFGISGSNLSIAATNGVTGGTYYLLGTTNLTTPIGQWLPIATNVVTASGGTEAFTFTGTNAYTAGSPGWFFVLSSTNN